MLQACNGLGPPANPGDIAVVNAAAGSQDVDFFTPDGTYKFSTSPLNCTTGAPLNSVGDGLAYFGLQPVEGCAATLPHVRMPTPYGLDRQVWSDVESCEARCQILDL